MSSSIQRTLSEQNTLKVVNKSNSRDPFKATKIWNEILRAFFLGIELNKHKRNMKTYYDCFTATQAVTWLKAYLTQCEHFQNKKVTRFQALNLLRKYHKSSIIERIKTNKNDKELQDNNELFRFSPNANENLPFLQTSKSEEDLLESCSIGHSEEVELNLNEKIIIYKDTIWQQILKLLPNICDFIKLEKIDGPSLYNNITRLNSNGVVQLADKTQDLPHWIMSAMKCLANWPKASGSGNCLPKYPGFESDVFNLIRDYFTNIEEPIIPFEFYYLLISSFDNYLQETTFKRKMSNFLEVNKKENSIMDFNNEINLPSNCVYETAFSGREPVTKIVPIDELSGVFPSIIDYFYQNENIIKSPNYSSSGTFKALSTMPRNTSKLKNRANFLTPQNMKNCNMVSDILCLDSPPEVGEYMLNKSNDIISRKFLSLQRTRQTSNNNFKSHKQYLLLQLILLTLPSPNRRYLQLLMRLFYKIIRNKELCLLTKDSLALKEHIVNIFTRCILRCHKENDYNELKAKEFISFLIDECIHIFLAPEEITKEIDKSINNFKMNKVAITNNFCHKISTEEFEMQRDVLSEVALSELMESIMRDETITERDKLKWIKQFKLYHPDVYDIYFANCNVKTNNERTSYVSPANRRTKSLVSTSFLPNSKFVRRFLSLKF